MSHRDADESEQPTGQAGIGRRIFVTFGSAYALSERRSSGYRWWKPLLVLVLAEALWLGSLLAVITIAVAIYLCSQLAHGVVPPGSDLEAVARGALPPYPDAPAVSEIVQLAIDATPLVALLAALWIIRRQGLGNVSSVLGRIRWSWLAWSLIPAGGYAIVVVGGGLLASVLSGAGAESPVYTLPRAAPWIVVAVVMVIPLQAAAEEYLFRGYLVQMVAGWIGSPVIAAVLSAVVFTAGHKTDVWGSVLIGAFALAASWVAFRTGGLEAALTIHALNNIFYTVISTLGLGDAVLRGPGALALGVGGLIVWAYATDRLYGRRGTGNVAGERAGRSRTPLPAAAREGSG